MISPRNLLPLSSMNKAIIILGRYPEVGHGKSRLAKEIGEDRAIEEYRKLVERLFIEVAKLEPQITPYFLFAEEVDTGKAHGWLGNRIKILQPKSPEIEKNLLTAFERVLMGKTDKVISIASDTPAVNKGVIEKAMEVLNLSDVLVGKDQSKGIYIFGVHRRIRNRKLLQKFFSRPEEFTPYDWVLKIVKKYGLNLYELPPQIDIDTAEDLKKWKNTSK